MAKLTLNDVVAGYKSTTAINANSAATEAAMEKTLSRDGTSPNVMEADLDMNGNNILNSGNALGSVTSVSGTAPIAVTSGATPTVSITASTTSAAGSMSAADKTKLDGTGTIVTQNANAVNIDGGNIDGTVIGAATPAAITGTSITATGALSGASLTVTKSDDPANNYHNLDSNASTARTWRFPDASDTSVGKDTTDTLTNKTLTAPVINSPTGLAKADVGLSNVDNTSNATERAATATLTNKTLTSPTINGGTINETTHTEAAHATTSDIWTGGNTCLLSGSVVTFTDVADAPAAGAVRYVVANAAHIITDNSNLEVDGNSNYTCAIGDLLRFEAKTTSTFRVSIVAHGDGAGSGNAQTANGLDQFAATTSAELAGVISNETGSGALVFAESPTLVTPALGTPASGVATNLTGTALGLTAGNVSTNANLTGHITSSGNAAVLGSFTSAQLKAALTNETGSGAAVFAESPTLVTPALGTPASGVATNLTGTAAGLTSGNVTTNANLTGHITSSGNATTLGSFSSANLKAALSDETGSGAAVFATSPTFVTPALGTPASGTLTNCTFPTLNQSTTGNATTATTATNVAGGAGGSVLYQSSANTTALLANGSDGQVLTSTGGTSAPAWENPAGGGDALTSGNLSQFAATTSAQLRGVLSDETGSGAAVFATSPTLVTPALGTPASGTLTNCSFPTLNQNTSGTAAGLSATLAVASGGTGVTSSTGSGNTVLSASPTLTGTLTTAAISASGNVGIGATSPLAKNHTLGAGTAVVASGSDGAAEAIIEGANIALTSSYGNLNVISNTAQAADTGGQIAFAGKSTDSDNKYATWAVIKGAKENATSANIASYLAFSTRADGGGNTEKMRITSAGGVGIGTIPDSILHIQGADPNLIIQDTNDTGDAYIKFKNNTGTQRGYIQTAMTSDVMILGTGTTERMRITSAGHLLVGTTDAAPWDNAADSTADNGIAIRDGGLIGATRYQSNPLALNRTGNNGTIVDLRRTGTIKGTIGITTTAVTYNTTSDYRLKENVEYDWDATSRLKQLKPARFNFIADPDNTVDGFLAHEAQEVVPESVTGVKDEVDDDDNPVMQGIDQAKLVPLLVKTIQELEARIAKLEGSK